MFDRQRLSKTIDIVLDQAKGYDTLVIVQGGTEALTRIANSEVHQNVQATKIDVTAVVTRGKKRSTAGTELCTEEGLRQAAREAVANLEYLPEIEEQPPLVEAPAVMESVHLDPELEQQYSVENRARLIARALATLKSDYRAFGALAYSTNILAVGNSRGIRRLAAVNSVKFNALVSSDSGGSGYASTRSNNPDDLDIPGVFDRAYEKSRLNRNPEELEPGEYTVILEPLAVGDIMTYLSFTGFGAKSVRDRAGFLTGKMGQKVFADSITIIDDWTDPNTVPLPFDLEGAPRQKVAIIEQGIAGGLTYDTAGAMKDGVATTGHSLNMPQYGGLPLNLVMACGAQSMEEMIAGTADGLLVTRFNYMNPVNPRTALLTALTRDGLFRIKDGKIAGAVKNMRFTESMLKALNNVEAVSRERQRTRFLTFFGNYYVPALKINNFRFTGKSG